MTQPHKYSKDSGFNGLEKTSSHRFKSPCELDSPKYFVVVYPKLVFVDKVYPKLLLMFVWFVQICK